MRVRYVPIYGFEVRKELSYPKIGCPQSKGSADRGHPMHVNQFHHAVLQSRPNFGPLTFLASTKLASRSFLYSLDRARKLCPQNKENLAKRDETQTA